MIRDDFNKGNVPDPNVWVALGSPTVSGGKLYLATAGDGVRGKTRFLCDDLARVTVEVFNGNGSVFITPYELNVRPDSTNLPYFCVRYEQWGEFYKVDVLSHEKVLSSTFIFYALKILIKEEKEKLTFIGVGKTSGGAEQPITLTTVDNPFYNQNVALYLFGGVTNIEYVEAGSGRELQASLMMETILPPLIAVVTISVFVTVLRTLIRRVKGAV